MELLKDIVSTFTRMRPYSFKGERVTCNLCRSSEHDIVGRRDRYANKLINVLCTSCGLVFTNPMPTEEELDSFYRRDYRKHYHNEFTPRKKAILRAMRGADVRYNFIKPVLKEGMRILDVGAGGGEFVNFMHDKGFDAHGIEPNEMFADYARRAYAIPIQQTSWRNAQVDEESYDLISASHVIEHFHDPHGALCRFWTWLKPGGRIHLSVPSISNPNRTPYARFHSGHLYNFTYETFAMMALKVGFIQSKETPLKSTTMVFDKVEPVADWRIFPDHYAVMREFFDTYTNRRYFFSPTPYFRWVERMSRLGESMLRATFIKHPHK